MTMNKNYYDSHLVLQGTYVPVREEPIHEGREVTDEDLRDFILGDRHMTDEEKAEALAAYGLDQD